MEKSAFKKAKIEPELKEEVSIILQNLGLSLTEAFFKQTKLNQELPFESKIPNEETVAAMEDAVLKRDLEGWASVDAFLESVKCNR